MKVADSDWKMSPADRVNISSTTDGQGFTLIGNDLGKDIVLG
jgi:hypothetical protein